jgi:hypothetical protein
VSDRSTRPGKHKARHRAPRRPARTREARPTEVRPRTGAPEWRRPAVISAAGGVLAASAVAGTVTLAPADEDGSTPQTSPSSAMEYQRVEPGVSRDAERSGGPSLSELKAEAMENYSYGVSRDGRRVSVQREELATSDSDPRDIALAMLAQYGWPTSEFDCLDDLWYGESQWDPTAENPYSGAYGIPQSLPAEKMAAAGPDWETNPATQIEWGLGYIQDRYGTPCSANAFKLANGWY